MDERFLLAAVLMVIGLQFGNGDIQITTDCRTGAKNSYNQLQGINTTNGVHLATHPPEATFGGNAIRCLTICAQEPDCSIAVMDGNSKECLTYSYTLDLGEPVKVIAPTFTSYVKAIGGYFVPKQSGPYSFSKALAECKKAEMKLPRIETSDDLEDLELLFTMMDMTDVNTGHLIWLQASIELNGYVQWDDGTNAPNSMQPQLCGDVTSLFISGCNPGPSYQFKDYALTIGSPSMKLHYGIRSKQTVGGITRDPDLSKYVVCQ